MTRTRALHILEGGKYNTVAIFGMKNIAQYVRQTKFFEAILLIYVITLIR
jgi:hypothetical protein